jgi:hypothetical protein
MLDFASIDYSLTAARSSRSARDGVDFSLLPCASSPTKKTKWSVSKVKPLAITQIAVKELTVLAMMLLLAALVMALTVACLRIASATSMKKKQK